MSLSQDVRARLTAPLGAMNLVAAPATALCPGLSVGLYQAGGGLFNSPPTTDHRLIIHVGAPVRANCRIDGVHQDRVQVRGDIDLVPAGAAGCWEDDGPATILYFRVSPALLLSTAEDMDMNPAGIGLVPQLQARDPQIEYIASALHSALTQGAPIERLFAESLGTAFVARLLHQFTTDAPALVKGGLSKRRLLSIIDYVEDNIDKALSLSDIAAVVGIGVSHLKTQFRRSMGMPVHQYVILRRVERARMLIRRGSSISQAAFESGFAHQSHLARATRRVLGLSPLEIVRQR